MKTATAAKPPAREAQSMTKEIANAIDLRELFRLRDFSDEDRILLAEEAMGLCAECRTKLRSWLGRGYNLARAMRETLWRWFGSWDHGRGCTPEARQ